jgi:tRNA dimethylallyltransferase
LLTHNSLLVIAGPTASGKTAVSLEMAKHYPVEIISGDSAQFYRGMDIGTAKVSLKERSQVPHHMIDILNPDDTFSVADFQRRVAILIKEIQSRNRLPVLVGGTGLYIESVVYDYQFPAVSVNNEIRERWNQYADREGLDSLYERVAERDPAAVNRIHRNDRKRLIRALEIMDMTDAPLSKLEEKRNKVTPYNLCMIGLTVARPDLYQRIEQRVDNMLKAGLIQEVDDLLRSGYNETLSSMQAIGYKEVIQYLQSRSTYEQTVALIKQNSRHVAKRQISWFKTMPQIQWVDVTYETNFHTHIIQINAIIKAMLPSLQQTFNTP